MNEDEFTQRLRQAPDDAAVLDHEVHRVVVGLDEEVVVEKS